MMKLDKTIRGKLFGKSTIYGKDGDTPYMTRYFFGRLRYHIFHRPDQDPDCHNHPWGFWTFPLTSYVEEVATPHAYERMTERGPVEVLEGYELSYAVVRRFRAHYRPADHTHRVLGALAKPDAAIIEHHGGFAVDPTASIHTIVVRDRWSERSWGFLKNRDGKWCWADFQSYVFGGGKSAPCQD